MVKLNYVRSSLVLLLFSNIFLLWENPAGDDIALSRSIYLSNNPHDYLGSFGTIFYGLFPSFVSSWWHSLLLFQLIISFIGLNLINITLNKPSPKVNSLYIAFSYFALLMAGASSRDGTMISFLLLAIGLLSYSFTLKNVKSSQILKVSAFMLLVFCFSFRPWLSVVTIPLLYWSIQISRRSGVKNNSILNVSLAVVLFFAPAFIDQAVKKIFELNHGYPEQMVMIHDLSTSFCWGTNSKSVAYAYQGLLQIAVAEGNLKSLCQFYRPNTWQAVVFPNSKDLSINGLAVPLELIAINDESTYREVRSSWLNSIKSDPFAYVQNHLMFGTQVMISGEMRELKIINTIKKWTSEWNLDATLVLARSLIKTPYDLLRSFHIFSPTVALIVALLYLKRVSQSKEKKVVKIYFISFLSWIIMTTIGYASDNGRYTYGAVILCYLGLFLSKLFSNENNAIGKLK